MNTLPIVQLRDLTLEILKLREHINQIISERTGQPIEKVARNTDRDYFMSAVEAKEYGIIDKVIK